MVYTGKRSNPLVFGPELFFRTVLTAAQVNTLFTTAIPTFPSANVQSGRVAMPYVSVIRKEAGAYTLGAATNLVLRWISSTNQLYGFIAAAGFLDQAAAGNCMIINPQNTVSVFGTFNLAQTAAVDGSGFEAAMQGGNTSGAGGDLTITTYYRELRLNEPYN
jgi:hypothetical protein